jgi:hypothetical protein
MHGGIDGYTVVDGGMRGAAHYDYAEVQSVLDNREWPNYGV